MQERFELLKFFFFKQKLDNNFYFCVMFMQCVQLGLKERLLESKGPHESFLEIFVAFRKRNQLTFCLLVNLEP